MSWLISLWTGANALYVKIALALILLIAVVVGVHLYDQHFVTIGETKCSIPKAEGDLANYKAQQAELDRLRGVVSLYEKHLSDSDPIVPGLAHRVFVYAACPDDLPQASPVAPRAGGPAEDAGGATAVERATQAVFEAARADAQQLSAIQQAWPQ